MAVKYGQALAVLVVATSMFAIASANKNWNTTTVAANWNHTEGSFWGSRHRNATQGSNRFVVGGSENWRFGFNYTDWATKSGPFFLNDALVFKYDPPANGSTGHSVYLLPNFKSFQNCDLSKAKKIGEGNQGEGEGFEFVLKRWQPYYFACGEHDGVHCNLGQMKFAVWPLIRRNY